MLGSLGNPVELILSLVALVIAITVHEFAHAFAAEHLGDPTPRLMGRLTLNPLAHLDPVGTILMILVRFGWGKPVQFDPFNLRHPRRDSAIISLAGPFSNFVTATICAVIIHFLPIAHPSAPILILVPILETIIGMNVV